MGEEAMGEKAMGEKATGRYIDKTVMKKPCSCKRYNPGVACQSLLQSFDKLAVDAAIDVERSKEKQSSRHAEKHRENQ